jgi:hypothetical protein
MPQELSIDIDTETDLKNFRDMIKYMSEKWRYVCKTTIPKKNYRNS